MKLINGTWTTTLKTTCDDGTTFLLDIYAAKPVEIELPANLAVDDYGNATEDQS